MSSVQASLKGAEKAAASAVASEVVPRSRYALFGGISLVGFGADLITKELVFRWLGEPNPPHLPGYDNTHWVIDGYFGFQTAVNTGALFGMGKGGSHWFAGLSVIAAVGIVFWLFFKGAARDRFLTVALASVTGGIFGNLYDRLGLWGNNFAEHEYGVRDWILMQIPSYPPWPNYNIADCLLVCGAALLMWHAVFQNDPADELERETAK